MKIFDFKNPRHIQILREEIQRAKRIMAEDINGFSADEIWSAMSEAERYNALISTKDDEGPDLADQYTDEDWDSVPADIQDLIDLSAYELAKRNQAGRTNLRAIDNLKKKSAGAQRLVDKYLQKVGRTDVNLLTKKQAMDLNMKLLQFLPSDTPGTSTNSMVDPYDRENPSRGYMGSTYRGD
jgi:hypothetical protein